MTRALRCILSGISLWKQRTCDQNNTLQKRQFLQFVSTLSEFNKEVSTLMTLHSSSLVYLGQESASSWFTFCWQIRPCCHCKSSLALWWPSGCVYRVYVVTIITHARSRRRGIVNQCFTFGQKSFQIWIVKISTLYPFETKEHAEPYSLFLLS